MIEFSLTLAQLFLFLSAIGCTVVSGFVFYMMIGKVNRKLPDEEQIPYLFMYPGKVGKVRNLYRKLYPTGFLHLVQLGLGALGLLLLIAGFSTLGSG